MNDLYEKMDFVLSGGALKLLTDFLATTVSSAIVLEPRGADLHILDATGTRPTQLILPGESLRLAPSFSSRPAVSPCEMEQERIEGEWPWALRMRGPHWEIYILLKERADEALLSELRPFAGLIRLCQSFQKTNDNESKLSRLSYMILATKNTLASIFEPMPLEYYAAFVSDVLRESLFPHSIAILQDDGHRLIPLEGDSAAVPPREGIYAQPLLPPTPVLTRREAAPYEVVLPITEAELRLFCVMEWNYLPDSEMLNFLELLGSLAVRALSINSLRSKNLLAASQVSSGDFTILSLSNVLSALRSEEDHGRFLSLVMDIFMELGQVPECLLAAWNGGLKGYSLVEHRTEGIKAPPESASMPAPHPARCPSRPFFDLNKTPAHELFNSWGLGECPWRALGQMDYLFPLCDGDRVEGFVALASKSNTPLTESQLAALRIVSQFAGYEIRKFNRLS